MVNPELVKNITERFGQGQKAVDIKEALLNEGWSEGDIDAAFAHIRHEALMQIPYYAKIHNWMESMDKRSSELPTRTVIQIFGAIGLIFLGCIFVLYFFLDPLGVRAAEREKQREETAISLRQALENYYQDNRKFPKSPKELVPTYLSQEPIDPKTKELFRYKYLDNGSNYEFCIDFEVARIRCIASDNSSPIPIIEDETSAPPQVQIYAINGLVYEDVDKNTAKADDEEGWEQLKVKIIDSANNSVCETQTDSSGIFNCNVPGQGIYTVTVSPPTGFKVAAGNAIGVKLPSDTSAQPSIETLFIGLVK